MLVACSWLISLLLILSERTSRLGCAMTKIFISAMTMFFLLTGSVRAVDRIRIGVPQQVVHWMVFPLAQQKGFFKEEGLDAEIVRITGPSGRSALMSGEIDYYTTIAFIVQSAILGLPVKVVAAYVTCPPFVLMSRPEFKSAQDLKGKTMGIGAPPGSSAACWSSHNAPTRCRSRSTSPRLPAGPERAAPRP